MKEFLDEPPLAMKNQETPMTTNRKNILSNRRTAFVPLLIALLSAPNLWANQMEEPQTLTGTEAIDHLKSTRQYESLEEAFQLARYSVREIKGNSKKAWARNQQHALTATFDSEGLQLTVQDENQKHYQSNWRLESAGGSQVATGEVRHDGQRVEIIRPGLTEWFVNRPTGLEHGFTLSHRPATADDQLQLTVTIEGDLKIQISNDGQHAELLDKATGTKVLDYDKLRVWDATGTELPARMASAKSGTELQLVVEDTHAGYPLTIDPTFTQQAFLKASNAGSGDDFGAAVAASGNTVAVGAPGEASNVLNGPFNNSRFDSGAVYVFVLDGTTWTQQAFLKASVTDSSDLFGNAISLSEDTLVVGAPGEDSTATGGESNNDADGSGAVTVFVRDGTTWSRQAFLKADNAESGDEFGSSVSVSGDTLVVGAANEDSNATDGGANNGASNAGAAYVFVRSEGAWTQQALLKADNAGANDLFGTSVGISGETIAIGAMDEESSATGDGSENSTPDAGAAYVFVRSGETWSQQAFLKADNAARDDQFGISIGISEDTIVVGANQEDTTEGNSGAAYIFVRSETEWSQQALLKADVLGVADQFGLSVAISGDRVAVSTPLEDSNSTSDPTNNGALSSGAAYLFERTGTTWTQTEFLKADNLGGSDRFGTSVAVSEDTVIAGAIAEDTSANNSGAAYIFGVPLVEPEPVDVEITSIEVNESRNVITLTWHSNPDSTYQIEYSQNLLTWTENLASGIPHDVDGEGLTSHELNLQGTDLDGATVLFLRVMQE